MRKFSNYENSIKLIDYIEDDNNIFILMEYCELNLDKYIKNRMKEKKPLKINEIKNILIQLNNILESLWRIQFAHRDLKPSNILLKKIDDKEDNFIVKLSDYGNTKNFINSITLQSKFKGTAIFKAPEILKNESNYDPIKTDLWSIGIIIYFMITGEYPFDSEIKINDEKKKLEIKIENNEHLNDLFKKLTYYNPEKRISFKDYFNHPFLINKKIKIIFLGESACGKTSIVKKIIFNEFNLNHVSYYGYYVKLHINILNYIGIKKCCQKFKSRNMGYSRRRKVFINHKSIC